MAMNKAEKAHVADLEFKLERLTAWKLTEDIAKDVLFRTLNSSSQPSYLDGWMFNAYNHQVFPVRTWSNAHSLNTCRKEGYDYNSRSQNGIDLYSTEALALRALRRHIELDTMAKLAAIDAKISKLENHNVPELSV